MSVQITVKPSDRLVFDDALSLLNASQEYHDSKFSELFNESDRTGGWLWSRKHLKKVIQTALVIEFAYNRMHENDYVRPRVKFIMDPVTHVWTYNVEWTYRVEPYNRDGERN